MIKTISLDLRSKKGTIEIIPFFDIHIGDPSCNKGLLKDWIEYVRTTPNAYAILGGDLINNTIKSSVGDIYEEDDNPTGQIARITEYFKPIKDKILLILEGNHEYRTYKETGISPCDHIAAALGLKERYSKNVAYLFLTTTVRGTDCNRTYTIYTTHGSSSTSVISGKAANLEKMSRVCDADLYLIGHTHDVLAFHKNYYEVDRKNKKLKEVTRTFVNANSFTSYGGYGAKRGYTPSTPSVPKIIFSSPLVRVGDKYETGKKCEVLL